jgi:hypothetical protein
MLWLYDAAGGPPAYRPPVAEYGGLAVTAGFGILVGGFKDTAKRFRRPTPSQPSRQARRQNPAQLDPFRDL